MASVQEVLAINSRPGDSIKGGGQTFGITIDASPFQRLAEYTYLDNVEKTKVKAAKDKEVATEMGKAMSLNINTTNKEIYDELDKQKQEILYLVKNNKDIFDYNKNPEANKKWQELYGQFVANREKATAFDLLNNSATTEIAKITDPNEQKAARQTLENNRKIALSGGAGTFFKTGTQLEPVITKFDKSDFAIPTAGELKYQTFKEGGNSNKTTLVEVGDFNGLLAQSNQAWLGLQQDDYKPEENPNNDPVIAARNRNAQIASEQKKTKLGKYSEETLKTTNNLIREYNKAYADWKAAGSQGREPEKPSIISSVEAVNRNILVASIEMQKQSARGGKPAVPAFKTIDLSDELSGPELVYLEAASKIKDPIKYTETGVNTGNRTQERGQDISNANADADRAERREARIARLTKGGKTPGTDGYEDGNDFDMIQDHKFPKGTQIVDGMVVNNDGKTLYTGDLQVPISKVPQTILSTITQLNKEGGYDQAAGNEQFVNFYVKDGVFQNVKSTKGMVTRKNQIAGQRSFDKRTAKETQEAFGTDESGEVDRTYE